MKKSVFNDSKISMRIVKRIVLIIFAVAVFCAAIACTPKQSAAEKRLQEFQAEIYDKIQVYMTEETLTENATHSFFDDTDYPFDIVRVVKSADEFNKMFYEKPFEADFDKEMVVFYFITDIYYGFECFLEDIIVEDNILTVKIRHDMLAEQGEATSLPTVRSFAVKMSVGDYDDIKVKVRYDHK